MNSISILNFIQNKKNQKEAKQIVNDIEEIEQIEQTIEDDIEQIQTDITAETAARTIADAEINRKVDMLYKLSDGVLWDIEQREESGATQLPKGGEFGNIDEARGKTEQDSTDGYNALPPNIITSGTSKGVTFVNNGDGSVSVFGTSQSYDGFTQTFNLENGAYIPCLQPQVEGVSLLLRVTDSAEKRTDYTSTLGNPMHKAVEIDGSEQLVQIKLQVATGYAVDCTVFPYLVKGYADKPYEPFTGGIPSPNPDYPQEIISVDSFSVKKAGKNLCETVLIGKAWNNANNSARAIVYAKVNKGKTYTISVQDISGLDSAPYTVLKENIGDTTAIASYTNPTVEKPVVITPIADGFVGIQCNRTAVTEADVANVGIMCEYGSVATAYEPYVGTIAERTITPPRPLNAIGEYKDVCDIVGGVWSYAIKRFNFSPVTWRICGNRDGVNCFANLNGDAIFSDIAFDFATANAIMCDSFAYKKNAGGWADALSKGKGLFSHFERVPYLYFNADDTSFPSVAAWREFIGGTTLLYGSVTPYSEEISQSDLAFLRNLTLLPGETLTVTDNHGRDVSYLMSDFINLKKAVEQ